MTTMSQDTKVQSAEHQPLVALVGQRIRDRRKLLGLSQHELGERIGLSRVAISHIENGQRKQLKPDLIRKVAQALNTPDIAFYGLPLEDNNLSPALIRIFQRVSSLPRSEQEYLASMIELLLGWRISPDTASA